VTHGLCPSCGALRRLDQAGVLAFHHIAIKVSRRAVKTVGAGKVNRRCPGSGKPPRRGEP
jgi:hypothetical protein